MKVRLRTTKTAKQYERHRRSGAMDHVCMLCKKLSKKKLKHWKIVVNDFPYDKIAERHDMIVPKRHVKEEELTAGELAELRELKKTVLQRYDYTLEATHKLKSIPDHFHLHLLTVK